MDDHDVVAVELAAVIFDLDGTLVDSRLDFARMRAELGAPAGVGLLEYVATLPSPQARDRAMAVIHRHEAEGARQAAWMPGAERALQVLAQRGVPTAIVTRNSREAARLTMDRLRIPAMPLRAREDAAPKPDPEALLHIASGWGIPVQRCAYVGDFHFDIEAAERAGMVPVLYTAGADPDRDLGERAVVIRHFDVLRRWRFIAP